MQTYETATTRLRVEEPGVCALVQDLLPLFLEGEVSPASRDQITEHLAGCERCAGFLAGAQSVRVQLRRDHSQRAASLQADAKPRGAVLQVRELLGGFAAMLLSLPGGLSAGLVAGGLMENDQGMIAAGVLGAGIICALLFGLARVMGPLTSGRASTLLSGMALGGAGVIAMMFSTVSPMGVVASLVIGIVGLVGVWSGVARDGRWPFVQSA
jgi:anti-sigma factor RsiW